MVRLATWKATQHPQRSSEEKKESTIPINGKPDLDNEQKASRSEVKKKSL